MYDIKWIGEIMNKNKIGIAVLLLGLSLGPVQTSQNYTIRLNNLVYAEDGANQPTTGEGLFKMYQLHLLQEQKLLAIKEIKREITLKFNL